MHRDKNRLIVAAAGSGKTSYLVREALQYPNDTILITTYTEANEAEIRKKFIVTCGYVPSHVRIQTWFSFLIQHGVKPFQGGMIDASIKGVCGQVKVVQCAQVKVGHPIEERNCFCSQYYFQRGALPLGGDGKFFL